MQSLPYARKTLVQFDYKEDGRSYVKTSHTVYSRDSSHTWYVMPKVLSQVYMHDLEAPTCRNGRKRTTCNHFFHPRSDKFNFCYPYFFYHTLTDSVGLVNNNRAFAEIFDYSSFTCQSRSNWKINIGVLPQIIDLMIRKDLNWWPIL